MLSDKSRQTKDLSKFGLIPDNSESQANTPIIEKDYHNELFQDTDYDSKPWWKANFFISEPILFGTWDGVYTSCVINLFGVITLMRTEWIVGNSGILLAIGIIVFSISIACIAVTAGIGISEKMGGGTIHFCLSQVLGARLGGAISIAYCFGQCVSCSLHIAGFTESLSLLLKISDPWFQNIIGISLIKLLLLVNIAGVKWVIRLQYFILSMLFLAASDFALGLFIKRDLKNGVIGYDANNVLENLKPQYSNLFSVFGVFFPAVTGMFAGLNMSGDLYNPRKSVPNGTFAAIGTCFFIYLLFVLGLGLTCTHESLILNTMMVIKVSYFSYFIIAALYVSALSYSLGSIYATPRIIYDIAVEKIIPGIGFLANSRGPNKVPIQAMLLYSLFTIVFMLIRNINVLATIVTIPYLLTFAFIEYAHFSLSMSNDMKSLREEKFSAIGSPTSPRLQINKQSKDYCSLHRGDLDSLFSGKIRQIYIGRKQSSSDQSDSLPDSSVKSPDEATIMIPEVDESGIFNLSFLGNRYLALFAALLKLVLMFLVNWIYALCLSFFVIVIWLYIGHVNPGVYPGVSKFIFFHWIKSIFMRCFQTKGSGYQQYIITCDPSPEVMASQITHLGKDFASRERYHQTSALKKLPSLDLK